MNSRHPSESSAAPPPAGSRASSPPLQGPAQGAPHHKHLWWQRGIIYHIYPRSFMDANGDGVGDLPGITQRLDYLVWLGVDAIWISPFYPSPMVDFGYDVSNYTDVHPMFGTLADFDALLAAAHARGLRVILDFVPNHTSNQHPWFLEARASRDNPRRDYYLWSDPAPGGGPPNNWLSLFGGSGWTLDPTTGQYYYHSFLVEQPDLNWRNPAVQTAMLEAMRFWLDRGIDGFRLDALHFMIKDDLLRDNPQNPNFRPGKEDPYLALLPIYSADLPEMHDHVHAMRRLLDAYPDTALLGELYLPVGQLVKYYGVKGPEVHLPLNFDLVRGTPWNARRIAVAIETYEAALPQDGWPNWVLGNHDNARLVSRFGAAQARVAALLLLTLRGTPTLYYGDELGMHDVPIPPDRVQDPFEKNVPGLGLGRDPERTPMQWDESPGAGFTTGTPWLPLPDDAKTINAALQRSDPTSMLSLYRRLIELRRAEPALAVGSYSSVPAEGDVLAYVRSAGTRRLLIALNLGPKPAALKLDPSLRGSIVLSTHLDRDGELVESVLTLRGDEGVVADIASGDRGVQG